MFSAQISVSDKQGDAQGLSGNYRHTNLRHLSQPDVPSIIAANAGELVPNDGVSGPANRTLHVKSLREESLKKKKKKKGLKTVKFEQAIDQRTELQ